MYDMYKSIPCDSLFTTLFVSNTRGHDKACDPYPWATHSTSQKAGPTPVPPPPPPPDKKKKEGKTLFEEPLIRTSLFHFEAILCVTFVFHLFCSTKQTHFSYVLQVGPTSLILWEAHPCKTSFPSWHSPLPSRELILFFEPPILSLPRGS